MWVVAKFDKKKFQLLKNEFKSYFGDECKIYRPVLLVEKFTKKKIIKKEVDLLNDYLFCYHESFNELSIMNRIKYFIGIKYLLNGFNYSQLEIEEFIKSLKRNENSEGYITKSTFEIEINKFYKFDTGAFANKIFKVLSLNKNKLSVMMGNIKSTIKKNELIFSPL